ncbi:MAG TPA: DUF1828 domain-containing protein [Dongiaceae bacterium]|nr:DUF1828 domain-containing protein [Dongiaceae bacterium]
MININHIQEQLCQTFCSSISVNPVPCGYAVSTSFEDSSGDRLRFYVVADGNGYRLEDSGDYLATLKASGIDFDTGSRGNLLNQVLREGDAHWDQDTFEIRTEEFEEKELAARIMKFTSALIRSRDVVLLTREMIRSTFREDALRVLDELYQGQYVANDNEAIDRQFKDFPADLVVRAKDTQRAAALYLVSNTEKLLEAQLMLDETQRLHREDVNVIALVESLDKISQRKFQRAQNRGLIMPIFAGDESAAIKRIGDSLGLKTGGENSRYLTSSGRKIELE